jgi:outer membrane PBP1 activator LpoA protein
MEKVKKKVSDSVSITIRITLSIVVIVCIFVLRYMDKPTEKMEKLEQSKIKQLQQIRYGDTHTDDRAEFEKQLVEAKEEFERRLAEQEEKNKKDIDAIWAFIGGRPVE